MSDSSERDTPELELLELAWGVIANAGWDGSAKTPGWQEAAVRWRDQYFALLKATRRLRQSRHDDAG